jgi:hypothetical protein
MESPVKSTRRPPKLKFKGVTIYRPEDLSENSRHSIQFKKTPRYWSYITILYKFVFTKDTPIEDILDEYTTNGRFPLFNTGTHEYITIEIPDRENPEQMIMIIQNLLEFIDYIFDIIITTSPGKSYQQQQSNIRKLITYRKKLVEKMRTYKPDYEIDKNKYARYEKQFEELSRETTHVIESNLDRDRFDARELADEVKGFTTPSKKGGKYTKSRKNKSNKRKSNKSKRKQLHFIQSQ